MSLFKTTMVLAIAMGGGGHPVSTLKELGPALTACWQAPAGSTGSEITIAFSLTRKGAVLGKPRITFTRLVGDKDAQRTFVSAALQALAACTPLAVTDGLGGAIAGRPLSVHFIGGPAGQTL